MSTTPGDGLKNDWADLQTLTTGWANAVANYLAYTRWPDVSQAVTDSGTPTDLTGATGSGADQYKVIRLTGAIAAGRNAVVTTLAGGWWLIYNGTTGGFAVTVKTSGGSGVAIPAGAWAWVVCDGTNVIAAPSWLPALTLGGDVTVADGKNVVLGTGTGTKIGTATSQKLGFWNHAPAVRPAAYTPTNVSSDRSYDANATTTDELADVLGTLISDLQSIGIIG